MKRGAVRAARRQSAAAQVLGAALWLGAAVASAEVIDLQWQDGGHFERSLTIAPGKFAEICGPLQPGQAIRWSFKADRAVNFNIHYHLDKDVRYPAQKDQIDSLQGDLAVEAQQDYCWMWLNKTTTAAKLVVALTRKYSPVEGRSCEWMGRNRDASGRVSATGAKPLDLRIMGRSNFAVINPRGPQGRTPSNPAAMTTDHLQTTTSSSDSPQPARALWIAAAMTALIGAFFLLREHWGHIAGYWPYLLLLACPVMHLFHGHGHHGHHDAGAARSTNRDA